MRAIQYKGWTLEQNQDCSDPDVHKIYHYAVRKGEKILLDWSAHVWMDEDDFRDMVDFGFPRRSMIGSPAPLSKEDLDLIAEVNRASKELN